MASEVIIGIFDKSLLVKTDSNWLFNILALSFAQLFVSPFMIYQNDPFVSFLYRTKSASYYFEKIL